MANSSKRALTSIWLTIICTVLSTGAVAQVISFETVPGVGTPTEGLLISDQYQATVGVTFSLLGGGSPRIAQVGDPPTAFYGPPSSTTFDTPAAGQNVGSFFLTDDGVVGGTSTLVITYSSPSAAASGVILDIDGSEQFLIEARNAANEVLDSVTITAGDPNTGDGIATPWSFSLGSNVISFIHIETVTNAGLAFDNFNATSAGESGSVPIPTLSEWGLLLLLALLGALGVLYLRRGSASHL